MLRFCSIPAARFVFAFIIVTGRVLTDSIVSRILRVIACVVQRTSWSWGAIVEDARPIGMFPSANFFCAFCRPDALFSFFASGRYQ